MSDDLRSRIAAALRNAPPLSDDLALADAVIRELGATGLQRDGSFIDGAGAVWRHDGREWTDDPNFRP